MDSGAWSLFRLHALKLGKNAVVRQGAHGRPLERDERPPDYAYFHLKKGSEFRAYCDRYAAFMKRHSGDIRLFANLDVIGSAEKTWEVQMYFEKEHGLRPVPVVHFGEDVSWIARYVEAGFDILGLGGYAGGVGRFEMTNWTDRAFIELCPKSNDHLPVVRVHGFAMTGWYGICRWPWWSVDSTSWAIQSAIGTLNVPQWSEQRQCWLFLERPPYIINVAPNSAVRKQARTHYEYGIRNSPSMRANVHRWLDFVGVPLGTTTEEGEMKEWGVSSHYRARFYANLTYFHNLGRSLPEWPWPLTEHARWRHGVRSPKRELHEL